MLLEFSGLRSHVREAHPTLRPGTDHRFATADPDIVLLPGPTSRPRAKMHSVRAFVQPRTDTTCA